MIAVCFNFAVVLAVFDGHKAKMKADERHQNLFTLSPILGAVITPQSTTMGALSAHIFRICVLLLRGSN